MFEVGFGILVLGAAALILSLVGRSSGWPIGQAFNNEFILVSLYAAHFRHLDFFPVWSSSDGLGLGTPVLLYYQKAYFYVAGFIFVVLGQGSLKTTLILTTAIFLVVGAYGMRLALSVVTESRTLRTVGAVGFLFTNYVFTDWLLRGDLPEFSAMMIVPWLLYWCLNLVKNRRVSMVLIPVLPLLVDAHSAIGLISIFTLVVALVTFVSVAGFRALRRVGPRLLVAGGGAAVLLAPTLLAEVRFSTYFDPASKVTHNDTVSQNFVSFWSYFYDDAHKWLSSSGHLDLQIDFAIWIPIALALLALLAIRLITGRPHRADLARLVDLPCLVFLGVSGLIYLVLQLRISLIVYRILSPLLVIDFSYRMLTFMIPIGLIVVVMVADVLFRRYPRSAIPHLGAVAWLLSLIVLSPITSTWTVQYGVLAKPGQFPSLALSMPPAHIDYRTYKGFFAFNNLLYLEYLPKVYTAGGSELYSDGPLYTKLHRHQDGAASLSNVPCTVLSPTKVPLESLSLTYQIACSGPTEVALPVTYNAFSSVFVKDTAGGLHRIPYFHRKTDPRMIIKVHSSKSETVVVHLPTLWGVLS